MADEPSLEYKLDNKRPVDLLDLANSFEGFAREYAEFVHGQGYDPQRDNVRLYVVEIKSGSIIAQLQTMADQASFLLSHAEVYAGFITNLQEITQYFMGTRPEPPASLTRERAERLAEILDPVAKDTNANLSVAVIGNTAPVTTNIYVVNSSEANAVQNRVRRYVGAAAKSKDSGRFEQEVMYLQQVRGDSKAKAGDRGIIEKFTTASVKLTFTSPDVKATIIDQHENPFKMAYIVDGEKSTVDGEPVLYKISHVHEVFERPTGLKGT